MIIYPNLIDQLEEIAFDFYLKGIVEGSNLQNVKTPDIGQMRDMVAKRVHKTLNEHITRKYETKRKL